MGWVVACASEIVANIKKGNKVALESREIKNGFICDLLAVRKEGGRAGLKLVRRRTSSANRVECDGGAERLFVA